MTNSLPERDQGTARTGSTRRYDAPPRRGGITPPAASAGRGSCSRSAIKKTRLEFTGADIAEVALGSWHTSEASQNLSVRSVGSSRQVN
jgi:hypothetical protein